MSRDEDRSRSESWAQANRRYLLAAVAEVEARLPAAGDVSTPRFDGSWPEDLPPSALDTLCHLFDLDSFERQVLLLCAGVELESRFAQRCGEHGPTFSLALAHLAEARWSALLPDAPLRYWHLIEMEEGSLLTTSSLAIDERILHFLVGAESQDPKLLEWMEPVPNTPPLLVASHLRLAERMIAAWTQSTDGVEMPTLRLGGARGVVGQHLALTIARGLDLAFLSLSANSLPLPGPRLQRLIRRLRRESVLRPFLLFVLCDGPDTTENAFLAVDALVQQSPAPLLIAATEHQRWVARDLLGFDLELPTVAEQEQLWRGAMETYGQMPPSSIERLVDQFSLDAAGIRAATTRALGDLQAEDQAFTPEALFQAVWSACRDQARPQLSGLVQRIEPKVRWQDLVLPPGPTRLLEEIAQQVRCRPRIHRQWGFATRGGRGLGIAVLFTGPSGTGKTMAAEVLAGELSLDLYRIDLSTVVSKYIGETEENLEQAFTAAEAAGAVLLFDEADALFGKRTEIQDSHDRYANQTVSHLLQRIESYRGLAVLTSNLKESIDQAFLRRFRFVVDFPFPDAGQRGRLWRRIFPPQTPVDCDPGELAQMQLTGGGIHNVALGAAFLAAAEDRSVVRKDLVLAAQREFTKLGQPLPIQQTLPTDQAEEEGSL